MSVPGDEDSGVWDVFSGVLTPRSAKPRIKVHEWTRPKSEPTNPEERGKFPWEKDEIRRDPRVLEHERLEIPPSPPAPPFDRERYVWRRGLPAMDPRLVEAEKSK